jgi:hypothetical protein
LSKMRGGYEGKSSTKPGRRSVTGTFNGVYGNVFVRTLYVVQKATRYLMTV